MPPRFYCPTLAAGQAILTETEAHHLAHVLRVGVGEPVELFNGQGLVGSAIVRAIQKRDIDCEVLETRQELKSGPEIMLATAAPKGERLDWLVEKAVELGVSRLAPLITARSVVDPRASKLDRLRQTIVAACKQCRRAHLMELSPVIEYQEFLKSAQGPCWVADPTGERLEMTPRQNSAAEAWIFVVGPEGGWTEEELSWAREHRASVISLGGPILRTETAGLALAAWGLFQRFVADAETARDH